MVGCTNSIELTGIVKQSSVYGPILCSLSTGKINKINKPIVEQITPEVGISALKFVDHICGAGGKKNIEDLRDNCCMLQSKKTRKCI